MVRIQLACGTGRRCALEIEITGMDENVVNTGWCSGRSSLPCSVVRNGVGCREKQRERIVVEMEVQEVEFLVVAFLPHALQHHHVQRVGIAHRSVEAQRLRPGRVEFRRGLRIAAGEQRDVVSERDQFLGQPVHHPFGAAIKLGGDSLRQRSNLRDAHRIYLYGMPTASRFECPASTNGQPVHWRKFHFRRELFRRARNFFAARDVNLIASGFTGTNGCFNSLQVTTGRETLCKMYFNEGDRTRAEFQAPWTIFAATPHRPFLHLSLCPAAAGFACPSSLAAVLAAVACSVGTQYGVKFLVDTLSGTQGDGVWLAFLRAGLPDRRRQSAVADRQLDRELHLCGRDRRPAPRHLPPPDRPCAELFLRPAAGNADQPHYRDLECRLHRREHVRLERAAALHRDDRGDRASS